MLAEVVARQPALGGELGDGRRVQVGGLLGDGERAAQRRGRAQVADPQAGREHLGQRLDDDRAVARGGLRGQQVDGLALEPQRAVRVVLDQPQAGVRGGLGERRAALGGIVRPVGFWKVGIR